MILRSLAATFATLCIILLSTIVGVGWAGSVGIAITPISASAPIIIVTLAIADSIHILVSLNTAMREGKKKTDAIVEAIRQNFLPVTITSLTTIIGFMALNFSDSPPFWHLGNITAVGIAAAWLFSITLLPALMSLVPYRVEVSDCQDRGERFMEWIADVAVTYPRRLLIAIGGMTVVLASFIPTIEFNDQWIKYFGERIEFRVESDEALQYFGMYPIEYSIPAQSIGGVSDPEYLEYLDDFANFLRKQPAVRHVYSFSDVMMRLNKNLHGDDPDFFKIPETRDEAAQYLLLYELSLPYGLDLNDRINVDKSATRVTATLDDVDSIQTREFLNTTRNWMAANIPEWMHAEPTSAQVMFTFITARNVDNMISGTVMAIVIIALVLMVALRSFWLGLLSLLSNGLPIVAAFGVWAVLVGKIGFSVATVASISLGIVVDDTVHLLSKYVRARREHGGTVADAIRYSFRHVGVAIHINSAILVAGFMVLLGSSFKINIDMGLLTALSIALALVIDFLLLPPLLLLTDRAGARQSSTRETDMNKLKTASHPATLTGLLAILVTPIIFAAAPPLLAQKVTPVRGESESQRIGFEVAARSDRSDRGFGDSEVSLEMVLRNAAGKESTRSLQISTLENPDENYGDKTLVVFDNPKDIEGTALLSHANILDPDNQWLFLPALKRVKRISSANKTGPFVGSEFAFEDFTSMELNKYDYEWLHEEEYDGMSVDVVEARPRYENSGYTRQITWIDRDVHQVRKIDFYDRRGDLLKTLTLSEFREYDGIWRSHTMQMVNQQTKKSTELRYGDFQFNSGLSDGDFVKGQLMHLR